MTNNFAYTASGSPGPRLLGALIAARKAFKPIIRSHTGQIQSRTYKYADLADTMEATLPALHENGVTVVQYPEVRLVGDSVLFGVVTVLVHAESCEHWAGFVPIPGWDELTPQEMGSAMTYARRYAYSSMLFVASEDDDDGGAASAGREEARSQRPPQQQQRAAGGNNKPQCPQCGQAKSVIRSKFEDADWVCYDRIGGCGHKWFVQGPRADAARGTAPSAPAGTQAQKADPSLIAKVKALASELGLNAVTLQPILRECAPTAPLDAHGRIRSDVLTAGEAAIVLQRLQVELQRRGTHEPEEPPF